MHRRAPVADIVNLATGARYDRSRSTCPTDGHLSDVLWGEVVPGPDRVVGAASPGRNLTDLEYLDA